MSELKDGKRKMSVAVNWQREIEQIAGPYEGNRKAWLAGAARAAKCNYRQVKALYYEETTDPKHSVASKILSAADQARLNQAKQNVQLAAQNYATHAAALERLDPDQYREQIDALVNAARLLGERNST